MNDFIVTQVQMTGSRSAAVRAALVSGATKLFLYFKKGMFGVEAVIFCVSNGKYEYFVNVKVCAYHSETLCYYDSDIQISTYLQH